MGREEIAAVLYQRCWDLAKLHLVRWVDIEDVVQAAMLAMVPHLDRYTPEKGSVYTWADKRIRKAMRKYVEKCVRHRHLGCKAVKVADKDPLSDPAVRVECEERMRLRLQDEQTGRPNTED